MPMTNTLCKYLWQELHEEWNSNKGTIHMRSFSVEIQNQLSYLRIRRRGSRWQLNWTADGKAAQLSRYSRVRDSGLYKEPKMNRLSKGKGSNMHISDDLSQRTCQGLPLPCQGSWDTFSIVPRGRLPSGTSKYGGKFSFVLPSKHCI